MASDVDGVNRRQGLRGRWRVHRLGDFSGAMWCVAESEGFEPPVPCGTPDFESGTFNHSDSSPLGPRARSKRVAQACGRSGGGV